MLRSSGGAIGVAMPAMLVLLACSVDDRMLTVIDAASPPPQGVVLRPDEHGFLDGSNAAGITGYWYVTSDATGPDGCLAVGFSPAQCSQVLTPLSDGHAFDVSDPNSICTSGVAAQVIANPSTAQLDFDHIWGAEIGVDFNNPDRANPNRGAAYDARAHAITGFSFVMNAPPTNLRVVFPTIPNPDTAAYWGGRMTASSPVRPGLNVLRWANVGGPLYLTDPPAFDETQVRGMQFVVVSNATHPVPYDFCVDNLTALME